MESYTYLIMENKLYNIIKQKGTQNSIMNYGSGLVKDNF